MLVIYYLERTPKAERARGRFLLLIMFIVLFARFSSVQHILDFYAAATSAPLLPTYIHTRAHRRQRGPSAPINWHCNTHLMLTPSYHLPTYLPMYIHLGTYLGGYFALVHRYIGSWRWVRHHSVPLLN